jgi:hypothetical protein
MSQNVTITPMNIDGREFILAEVSRGMGQIGVFRHMSTKTTALDVMFIEKEPILKIFNNRTTDEYHSKSILQISGAEKAPDFIQARLTAAVDNLFNYTQGLARSATPVLELLCPGLYVVHESQMHPSDGSGGFFWNAYSTKREFAGSSDKNQVIGNGNYSPCFLIPTYQPAGFQAKKMYTESDKYKTGEKLRGVAYHVSGMFSALLTGHHAATAALLNDTDFRCMVIEPLSGVVYNEAEKKAQKRKVIALSCPYVNIPLEDMPDATLERFLVTRKHIKPVAFTEIKAKLGKVIRTVSKKAFPAAVYEKAEQLPDTSLVESAADINHLTGEQLTALLDSRVKVNDDDPDFIVSSNHYSSIVSAANFLQTVDFNRFLGFAVEILEREDLSVAHKYIAERLLTIMHPDIFQFFNAAVEAADSNAQENVILEVARKYVIRWRDYSRRKQDAADSLVKAKQKKAEDLQAIAEAKGIQTLEAAVRTVADIPRNHG